MSEQRWAYIGRDSKGVAQAATVDTGDKRTRKDVSDFMAQGLTIERVPVEWVRQHLFTDTPYVPTT